MGDKINVMVLYVHVYMYNRSNCLYLASSVRAMTPEATGAAALVPTKSVTHMSSAPVVTYTGVDSPLMGTLTNWTFFSLKHPGCVQHYL